MSAKKIYWIFRLAASSAIRQLTKQKMRNVARHNIKNSCSALQVTNAFIICCLFGVSLNYKPVILVHVQMPTNLKGTQCMWCYIEQYLQYLILSIHTCTHLSISGAISTIFTGVALHLGMKNQQTYLQAHKREKVRYKSQKTKRYSNRQSVSRSRVSRRQRPRKSLHIQGGLLVSNIHGLFYFSIGAVCSAREDTYFKILTGQGGVWVTILVDAKW